MAAHDLLRAVAADDAYANLVWPGILAQRGLGGRDAAFATELGYGTLRWRARHDAILAACIDRDLAQVEAALLDALRLGVHQLTNMRVGQHAGVDQTVALVRAVVGERAVGFANAVLRRVARGGPSPVWMAHLESTGSLPGFDADPAGHLAITQSHPRWIVTAVHEALTATWPQRSWSDTAAHLAADNEPGSVTLAARVGTRDELLLALAAEGIPASPGRLSPLAVRLGNANPATIREVATGAAGVQDEGSQVVALQLIQAPLAGSDARWLDLCAGPGGKAALLAGAVARRGGSLTAVEVHQHRAALVRSALRPIQGRHEVIVADATRDELGHGYDRVLVDAPCTGLGALRRRPESRWRRRTEDLPALTALQRALLRRALDVVRPGGLVLYATCSPHLAETESVVADARRRGAEPVGEPLRLWPAVDDTDGMFAALLRRPE